MFPFCLIMPLNRDSSYLNGHCFVSLMLCVPVWKKDKISWLSVPLGYRMWTKQKSKLELAADMIRQIMPECRKQKNVILLCDSWYMKNPLVSLPEEYPNLDMIGNVREDSILYDLPPARTGRKGRPAGHGRQLSIETDFIFSAEKTDCCFIAVRPVITNLFGSRKVLAYVTAPEPGSEKKRLFSVRFFWNSCRFSVLAGKGTPEPYRQCMDEIYSAVLLWIPVEHRNQLL